MANEEQILSILSSIQADIAYLKERQELMQADITSFKELRDVLVKSASKIRHGNFENEAPESNPDTVADSAPAFELANKYWAEALPLLQNSYSDVVFNAWIEPLTPLRHEDNLFVLKCDREFAKKTIVNRYLSELTRCLRTVIGRNIDVQVVSSDDLKPGDQ